MTGTVEIRATRRAPARGFSLFEVLITVMVMAIGLLGLAGLQVIGLRKSNEASQRTYAIHLAQDIAERIRANTTAANFYDKFNSAAYSTPSPTPDCRMASCTPQQMAGHDMRQWQAQIDPAAKGELRSGSVAITRDAADTFRIQVGWSEGANPRSYTLQFHP